MLSDLELFQSIVSGITQAKSIDALLALIVSGLIDGLIDRADFAARIWLLGTPTTGADGEKTMRLSAIAGYSQVDGRLWNGIEGEFSKIRMVLKIGHIAQSGESLHLDEQEIANSQWTAYPNWVAREGIKGFAGYPLIFRGEVLSSSYFRPT